MTDQVFDQCREIHLLRNRGGPDIPLFILIFILFIYFFSCLFLLLISLPYSLSFNTYPFILLLLLLNLHYSLLYFSSSSSPYSSFSISFFPLLFLDFFILLLTSNLLHPFSFSSSSIFSLINIRVSSLLVSLSHRFFIVFDFLSSPPCDNKNLLFFSICSISSFFSLNPSSAVIQLVFLLHLFFFTQ